MSMVNDEVKKLFETQAASYAKKLREAQEAYIDFLFEFAEEHIPEASDEDVFCEIMDDVESEMVGEDWVIEKYQVLEMVILGYPYCPK